LHDYEKCKSKGSNKSSVEATPEPSKQKQSTEEKIITPQIRASKRHHSPVKASDLQESY
jgi:hypothetical protein